MGLRFKGSIGSLSNCVDEQGSLICAKLGMKIKFSEYEKDLRFYGLKRINLHGMVHDTSKVREKVAYKLFRDMGVMAPRSAWARLEVNGASLGLFSLVEQVDGRFTNDRWPSDGNGNLYKEAWPLSNKAANYENKLKTNKDVGDHTQMISLYEAMSQAPEADLYSTLGAWSNIDNLFAYMAVNDTINNWDGVGAWYCDPYRCSPHNFYIYQYDNARKFELVPWDLDYTLVQNSTFDHVPHWTQQPVDCDKRYLVFGNSETMAPGCDLFFIALASDYAAYAVQIDKLLEGSFDLEKLRGEIDDYADFIRYEVEADPDVEGAAIWMSSVESLKADLAILKQRAEGYRDDTARLLQ